MELSYGVKKMKYFLPLSRLRYSQLQLVRGLSYTVSVELHQLKQVDQHHSNQGFLIAQIFSQLEIIIYYCNNSMVDVLVITGVPCISAVRSILLPGEL